jgi:hypothetical protein
MMFMADNRLASISTRPTSVASLRYASGAT